MAYSVNTDLSTFALLRNKSDKVTLFWNTLLTDRAPQYAFILTSEVEHICLKVTFCYYYGSDSPMVDYYIRMMGVLRQFRGQLLKYWKDE